MLPRVRAPFALRAQGDSDRYLPALLYGCIPVLSDRIEAMPLDELPEMQWTSATLGLEREMISKLPGLLTEAVGPRLEASMRALHPPMLERLLYTSFEFSGLPTRGVPCVGCAAVRTDCKPKTPKTTIPSGAPGTKPKRPSRRPAGAGGGMSNNQKRLERAAVDLKLNTTREPYCGRRSWLGESGARDAFEGLVAVLRRRMSHIEPSDEPWPASRALPLSRAWFVERSKHYKRLVATQPPLHSLLRATAPSPEHRRNLAALMGYGTASA